MRGDLLAPSDQALGEPFADFLSHVRAGGRGQLPNLVVLAGVGSTNRLARRLVDYYLADELTAPPVGIVAMAQSEGRGRLGRSWSSPPGSGVLATLVVPAPPPSQLGRVPLAVAVSLVEALVELLGEAARPLRLKWPNDLVVGRRKLGGVLIEVVPRGGEAGAMVIGFGLNVLAAPPEVPQAIALSELGATSPPPPGWLACHLLEAVAAGLSRLEGGELVDTYRSLSAHREGERLRCAVGEEVIEGTFIGLDDHGRLRLVTLAGERVLSSAEVLE